MIDHYIPIFIFIGVGVFLGAMLLFLGACLGPRRPNPQKAAPYECGFEPFHTKRISFDIRFYLVAILFIIFDLEMVFLFPFAIALDQIPWSGFVGMGIFLSLLILGFIYEWKKGALEWE